MRRLTLAALLVTSPASARAQLAPPAPPAFSPALFAPGAVIARGYTFSGCAAEGPLRSDGSVRGVPLCLSGAMWLADLGRDPAVPADRGTQLRAVLALSIATAPGVRLRGDDDVQLVHIGAQTFYFGSPFSQFGPFGPYTSRDYAPLPEAGLGGRFVGMLDYYAPDQRDGDPNYYGVNPSFVVTAIPEPTTLALAGAGVLLLGAWARRRRAA